MSGGSILGGVVGAVAGYFMPGGGAVMALKGMQMGMTIGGYLDPPKGPTITGPRLDDLTIQTSTYGAFIPRGYGTFPVMGNVFWIENNKLKEKVSKKKSGGKGGGGSSTTKTYTYYATFAVGLCMGPITGVRRIWIGSKLVYDASSTNFSSLAATNAAATGINIHLGDDTQLADTRMQATLGVSNTPAYRGLAYIVFKDLLLTDYGNTIQGAQVKVEVVKNGTLSYFAATQNADLNQNWQAVAIKNGLMVAVAYATNVYATSKNGVDWTLRNLPSNQYWQCVAASSTRFVVIELGDVALYSNDGTTWYSTSMPSYTDWQFCVYGSDRFVAVGSGGLSARSTDGAGWIQHNTGAGIVLRSVCWTGTYFVATGSGAHVVRSKDGITWEKFTSVLPFSNAVHVASNGSRLVAVSDGIAYSDDNGRNWTLTSAPTSASWRRVIWTGSAFYTSSSNSSQGAYSYDGISWTVVSQSQGVYSYVWNGSTITGVANNGLTCKVVPFQITSLSTTLDAIVSTECQIGKLTTGDIDVTDLASKAIRGYRLTSPAALKASFDQLQAVYPFDIIQSGYKLKFKARGGSSVVTIPKEDLAAVGVS